VSGASSRRATLSALTAVCVVAHAAALGGLSTMGGSAPMQAAGASAAMQVRLLPTSLANAKALQSELDVSMTSANEMKATAQRADSASKEARRVPLSASKPEADVRQMHNPVDSIADRYLPTSVLDIRPMPRSAPDESRVEHVHKSGLPIRVRLYVEPNGSVSSGDIRSVAPGDEESAAQVIAMFRDTAFSPGRLQGREVASFIDIEIVLEPKLPESTPIVRH
jgi:hypothetical protein